MKGKKKRYVLSMTVITKKKWTEKNKPQLTNTWIPCFSAKENQSLTP